MNYRRPKFLEVLIEVRQEMARDADYDVDLFAEMVRGGSFAGQERPLDAPDTADSKPPKRTRIRTAKSAKR